MQTCWSGLRVNHQCGCCVSTGAHPLEGLKSTPAKPKYFIPQLAPFSHSVWKVKSCLGEMLTSLLCLRLMLPRGPCRTDCASFRRDSEYDRSALNSKQEDNTPEPPTLALANRSLRWWLNGINSGTGSALPWHWVCARVHTYLHDEQWSLRVKEIVPWVCWRGCATV